MAVGKLSSHHLFEQPAEKEAVQPQKKGPHSTPASRFETPQVAWPQAAQEFLPLRLPIA